MSQLRQASQLLRGNPQALINRFMGNTPQMQEAQRLIQSAGGDARKAFYDLAAQKGVDPDDVLAMLR